MNCAAKPGTDDRIALLVPLARAGDAVLVETIDQRAAGDAEHLRGARLITRASLERLEDALLLESATVARTCVGMSAADGALMPIGGGIVGDERKR